jgi:hypothetical protein
VKRLNIYKTVKMILLLGVVVLIIGTFALGYFMEQKSEQGRSVTEAQDTLAQDTASAPYTFSYPKSDVSLKVTQEPSWGLATQREKGGTITNKVNPQGVLYDRLALQHQSEILAFYTEAYGVSITIENEKGMSVALKESVFEEIIRTFALKE